MKIIDTVCCNAALASCIWQTRDNVSGEGQLWFVKRPGCKDKRSLNSDRNGPTAQQRHTGRYNRTTLKLTSVPVGTVFLLLEGFYRGADKSFARPTSLCILFDGESISFVASLVIYTYIYK